VVVTLEGLREGSKASSIDILIYSLEDIYVADSNGRQLRIRRTSNGYELDYNPNGNVIELCTTSGCFSRKNLVRVVNLWMKGWCGPQLFRELAKK
jgi:hypothetical protein